MPEFNLQVWEEKARARYTKGGGSPSLSKKLTSELAAIRGLGDVIAWCNFRRINVKFSKRPGGLYNGEERTIYINSRQSTQKKLYILLHECGHLLIDDRSESTEFRFKNGYYSKDQNIKRKFIHRCTILEEEFEAWHRGRKLATKLGIKIDDESFSALKAKFLKSYMKWALGDPAYQTNGPE